MRCSQQIQDRYESFVGVLNEGFKASNDHLKSSLELIYQRETDFFDKADSTVETLAERLTNAASLLVVANQQTETD
jgi:hypothetical protein